jgi:hypothetical protein
MMPAVDRGSTDERALVILQQARTIRRSTRSHFVNEYKAFAANSLLWNQYKSSTA